MAKFPVQTLKGKNVPTNKDYLLKWGGGVMSILVVGHRKSTDL